MRFSGTEFETNTNRHLGLGFAAIEIKLTSPGPVEDLLVTQSKDSAITRWLGRWLYRQRELREGTDVV